MSPNTTPMAPMTAGPKACWDFMNHRKRKRAFYGSAARRTMFADFSVPSRRMPAELHETSLIALLAIGFVLALLFGLLANMLRVSPHRRLPARRHRGGTLHAGIRRRFGAGLAARRNRRDPADVRRGPAFLRSRICWRCAPSRCPAPWRRSSPPPAIGYGMAQLLGWSSGRGTGIRTVLVGGQHRGAAARARGAQRAAVLGRKNRRGLADRRGPGHGAGAGAAAGARTHAGWRRPARCTAPGRIPTSGSRC